MTDTADELKPLRKAAKGLLYPSDTDEPIEVVSGVEVPAGASVSSVAAFFGELADDANAARFERLRAAVDSTLRDAKVYRAGSTEVDVFILGFTRSGALAGLKTASVET